MHPYQGPGGYEGTDRCPLITEAAERLRTTSFVLDGKRVILDGLGDFARLHARRHDREVQLLGFDLLERDRPAPVAASQGNAREPAAGRA